MHSTAVSAQDGSSEAGQGGGWQAGSDVLQQEGKCNKGGDGEVRVEGDGREGGEGIHGRGDGDTKASRTGGSCTGSSSSECGDMCPVAMAMAIAVASHGCSEEGEEEEHVGAGKAKGGEGEIERAVGPVQACGSVGTMSGSVEVEGEVCAVCKERQVMWQAMPCTHRYLCTMCKDLLEQVITVGPHKSQLGIQYLC